MNPEMTWMLAAQRHDELVTRGARHAAVARAAAQAGAIRRARRRPWHWQVNWSRTTLAPARDGAGQAGRSWVIIISATRGA
jgi:hypothetical protein